MADKMIKKSAILHPPELTIPAMTGLVGKKRVGNTTARRAAQILVEKQLGFTLPTPNPDKPEPTGFIKTMLQ